MQEYIPLKDYAIKNKISIFKALKLVKENRVEYITKEVDGKEKIFIKKDVNIKKQKQKSIKKEPTIKDLMQEIEILKQKVALMEQKINSKN